MTDTDCADKSASHRDPATLLLMFHWRPSENPFPWSVQKHIGLKLLYLSNIWMKKLAKEQKLLCSPWTGATNDSMYTRRAILCTVRVMFSSWTLKFTTPALTSHATSCPPGLLGRNNCQVVAVAQKSTQKYQTKPTKYRASQKKLCIAIPLLPGQSENIQQSEGNQGHN